MKKILLTAVCLIGLLGFQDVQAQEQAKEETNFPKMDTSPMDMVVYSNQNGELLMRVIYSRPQKRDREVFGKLVPYGEVWRTGANETTEITFYKKMKVGDKTFDAGTYALYTIPNEKEWTIILNKDIGQWGAYKYDEENDLLRFEVPVNKSEDMFEPFTIRFDQANGEVSLQMIWANTLVSIPIEF
jgi:hypothetical protein